MLILGVDPGTATTGFGLVRVEGKPNNGKSKFKLVDFGCIVTSKDSPMPQRLLLLQKELKKLLQQHKPDIICVEQLFFGINARTAMTVGQARGVVMATAASEKVEFYEYQGLSVKLAIGGYGRADKKQVQKGVEKLLGIKELKKPEGFNGFMDDAVDAIAIALCHVVKQG